MSNLIHCDGPGCHETRPPGDGYSIRMCDLPWLQVIAGTPSRTFDFHDQQCLANWTTGKPRVSSTELPCTCHAAASDPHTKGEHLGKTFGASTAEVNGL